MDLTYVLAEGENNRQIRVRSVVRDDIAGETTGHNMTFYFTPSGTFKFFIQGA
jgi:hypothetical protein